MSPTVRRSRAIRQRVAKKKAPKVSRNLTIDRNGLVIDGRRFRPMIGADVEIDHLIDGKLALVTVGIYAETVDVRGPLPRGATITHRHI